MDLSGLLQIETLSKANLNNELAASSDLTTPPGAEIGGPRSSSQPSSSGFFSSSQLNSPSANQQFQPSPLTPALNAATMDRLVDAPSAALAEAPLQTSLSKESRMGENDSKVENEADVAIAFILASATPVEGAAASQEALVAGFKHKYLEMLREREQLKRANEKLENELSLQKKRKRSTPSFPGEISPSGKILRKQKTPAQKAKIYARWLKLLQKEARKVKFNCSEQKVVVKDTNPVMVHEFEDLIADKGKDESKSATGVVRTRAFDGIDAIRELCGPDWPATIPVVRWKSHPFMKSYASGEEEGRIESLRVVYNKNKLSLHLNFQIVAESE